MHDLDVSQFYGVNYKARDFFLFRQLGPKLDLKIFGIHIAFVHPKKQQLQTSQAWLIFGSENVVEETTVEINHIWAHEYSLSIVWCIQIRPVSSVEQPTIKLLSQFVNNKAKVT